MSSSSRSMRDGRSDIEIERREPAGRRLRSSALCRLASARARSSISARRGCPRARAPRRRSRRCARAALGLRDRLRGRLLDGLRVRGSASASSRARPTSPSRCTRRSPGFMGHAERGKKLNMAVGMLDHSAGIAKAAGAEVGRLPPRVPARADARGGDRRGLRAARRAARAPRGRRAATCRSGSR